MATENVKPLFTITPATSISSVLDGQPEKPSEVAIGMPNSDSTARLMPTPTDDMQSQDSRESLLTSGRKETWYTIFPQVCVPFFIAGIGMVCAGVILDIVKDWEVFKNVPEFLILVTPLLGLKGNLEMTLASRLSTQANLGGFDLNERKLAVIVANLSLVQVQGIAVGFLSAVVATVIGVILPGEKFDHNTALLLCASSMFTAAIASFALGLLMIMVIIYAKKCKINPDNVATPIAGAVGDVATLSILAYAGKILYSYKESTWISPTLIGIYVALLPLWVYLSSKDESTRKVLITGWKPVICAMFISSAGGFILDEAEQKHVALALYQPVINGVGGNLVSVQASRISTTLHRDCDKKHLPDGVTSIWATPMDVFARKGVDATATRVLLGMVIPGHLVFAFITYLASSDAKISALFMISYIVAAFVQVAILLNTAVILIRWLWLKGVDPDTSSIPYLTALGDLLGTALLFFAFEFVGLFPGN